MAPRETLDRLRRTVRPLARLGLALVAAGAATVALLPWVAGGGAGSGPWDPLAARAEVRLDADAAARAPELAARVRAAVPRGHVELVRADGATWVALVARGAPGEVLGELRRALAAEGVAGTTFTMGRQLGRLVEVLAEDPGSLVAAGTRVLPLVLLVGGVVLLAAGAWWRREVPREPPRGSVGRRAAVGLALGVACLACVEALSLVLERLGVPIREQPWVGRVVAEGGAVLALAAAYVVLVAPLAEEVFFRGWLLPALAGPWGAAGGAVLSSVAFAVVHGNPPAFAAYVAYGLLLAWGALRWRSLVVPVVAHAVVNAVALAAAAG